MPKSPVSSSKLLHRFYESMYASLAGEVTYPILTKPFAAKKVPFSRLSDPHWPYWNQMLYDEQLRQVKWALERVYSTPLPSHKLAGFRPLWPYLVLPILLNK